MNPTLAVLSHQISPCRDASCPRHHQDSIDPFQGNRAFCGPQHDGVAPHFDGQRIASFEPELFPQLSRKNQPTGLINLDRVAHAKPLPIPFCRSSRNGPSPHLIPQREIPPELTGLSQLLRRLSVRPNGAGIP